jgi:TetR/AcrR family transcriptional regulator, transcriptional repressor for nem operon
MPEPTPSPRGPQNAKSQQKERTHEAILDSAARLIREKGIAGASVADVMKGAGLTVGGFYAHFASKEELVDTALRRTAERQLGGLFAGLDAKPVADRAEVVLKRYLSAAHRDEPFEGCSLPAVVGEVATTAPEHRDALAAQLDAMADALQPHLSTAPRRATALGLIALMYGGLSLARALRDTELSDELLRACRALGARAARPEPKE